MASRPSHLSGESLQHESAMRSESEPAENLHRRVPTVDAHDASARIRSGFAKVDAWDRRGVAEAPVPHVLGEHLPLEDVAAGQADLFLAVGWAEDLHLEHGGGEVRAVACDRGESEAAELFQSPRAKVWGTWRRKTIL